MKIFIKIIIVIAVVILFVFLYAKFGSEDSWICDSGRWIKHGNPSVKMPDKICGGDKKNANIIVEAPKAGDIISYPVSIKGKARVFESQFNFRIKDEDGTVLKESNAMANAKEMGEYGDFNISVFFPTPKGKIGMVEIFDYSAKDGAEIDKVSIPVKFIEEFIQMNVFFNNNELDPEMSCDKVFPVERKILKTSAVALVALEELLKGPTSVEKDIKYFSNINNNVIINSIVLNNGIAKVDFNDALEYQVGGSCRTSAIRAQIAETLKQFPAVQDVIISINGRTEDILQP